MADVTIDNPKVQIDLSEGSSTTVPNGERQRVTILVDSFNGRTELNGNPILDSDDGSKKSVVEIDLFGGDTVTANTSGTRIRGYRVD